MMKFARLAQDPNLRFENLFNLLDVDLLGQGYKRLNGSKALGIDGVSKIKFGENLDNELEELAVELKTGRYRPLAKRETYIPKANGQLRPIAISSTRDKVVEGALALILNLAYEPLFIRNSYGFRPLKSAHDAIKASAAILKDDKRSWVVEIDFEKFFNTVPHRQLLKFMGKRFNDRRIFSLINRLLDCEIISPEKSYWANVGTPQGSVVSPILANIYLHYVLDEWFLANFAGQDAQMVRYADDAIFMFSTQQQALDFLQSLELRVGQFKLSLNKEKTKIIDFRKGQHNIFSFLGFTFYWARPMGRKDSGLRVKTQKSKLVKKIGEHRDWIKANRAKYRTGELMKMTAAKLRGHYSYYGFWCNRKALAYYFSEVTAANFKWLNRRSQKKSYNWANFTKLVEQFLPPPPAMDKLQVLGRYTYA